MPLQANNSGSAPIGLLADPLVLDEALGACRDICSAYGTGFRPEAHCRSVLDKLRGSREVAYFLNRIRRAALDSDPGGLAHALEAFRGLVVRHCREEVIQIIADEVPCEGVLPTFDSAEW